MERLSSLTLRRKKLFLRRTVGLLGEVPTSTMIVKSRHLANKGAVRAGDAAAGPREGALDPLFLFAAAQPAQATCAARRPGRRPGEPRLIDGQPALARAHCP